MKLFNNLAAVNFGLSCLTGLLLGISWLRQVAFNPSLSQMPILLICLLGSTATWLASFILTHYLSTKAYFPWIVSLSLFSLLLATVPQVFQPTQSLIDGLILTIAGALLTVIPPNRIIGVRVSWTYESPTIWHKTNTLGGWLLIIFGFILILLPGLKSSLLLPTIIIGSIPAIGVPLVYAHYLVHHPQP